MDKTTILTNFSNNPTEENCLKCLQYCYGKSVDFKDNDLVEIFDISVRYLMKFKLGHLTEEDSKVLITYFSSKTINKFGLNGYVKINILTDNQYTEKFGNSGDAICICVDDINEIFYSSKIIKQLTSNNISTFLRGMQSIFHEVIHSVQNNVIQSKGKLNSLIEPKLSAYIMTIETIIRRVDANFYKSNYSNLYKENHAEQIGLKEAIDAIKDYNFKLYEMYDMEKISKMIENYSQAANENLVVFGTSNSHLKVMDAALCQTIKAHPELLEQYPLLNLSFNKDGSKKNIIELIKDRKDKISNYDNIEDLNRLYRAICNEKNFVAGGLTGTKDEIYLLVDYLINNDYDEFEFDLLRYRLDNNKITEEQKQAIIDYVLQSNDRRKSIEDSNIHTKKH